MKFKCSTCLEDHDLSQISFGADAPEQWYLLTDPERESSELDQEQCIIETAEGCHFFIRACLEIPVRGTDQHFVWGVWCSLSEASFDEMSEYWENPDRIKMGPYFGWLCTRIPGYPDTMFMKTSVHQRGLGERPIVKLEESDHILSQHQWKGIEENELKNIVMPLLHDNSQ